MIQTDLVEHDTKSNVQETTKRLRIKELTQLIGGRASAL